MGSSEVVVGAYANFNDVDGRECMHPLQICFCEKISRNFNIGTIFFEPKSYMYKKHYLTKYFKFPSIMTMDIRILNTTEQSWVQKMKKHLNTVFNGATLKLITFGNNDEQSDFFSMVCDMEVIGNYKIVSIFFYCF